MKNFKIFVIALLFSVAVLCQPKLTGAANNPSATGSGQVTLDGGFRTFSFTAVQLKDGTNKGQAELFNRGQDVRVHVEIDCLRIFDGNKATMSGVVTESSDSSLVGLGAIFKVQDNGEGVNATPDTISRLFIDTGLDCHNVSFNPTMIPIDDGNVQVRP
jgi:hypothetical protein